MIRAIICDCFGVLYYGSLQAFLELAGPDKRSELMNVVTLSDYGYLTRDEFNQSVGELIGKTGGKIEAIVTAQRQRNVAMVEYVRTGRRWRSKQALETTSARMRLNGYLTTGSSMNCLTQSYYPTGSTCESLMSTSIYWLQNV